MELRHPIKVAAARSQLSTHVIRVWEKRYGTITPDRKGQGRRRFYSEAEIERLSLLRMAIENGHSIGNISGLPGDELRRLVGAEKLLQRETFLGNPIVREAEKKLPTHERGVLKAPEEHLALAIGEVAKMNAEGVLQVLEKALVDLGPIRVIVGVIGPLVEEIGTQWERGTLQVAHEHVATAAIRNFLGQLARPYAASSLAPVLLITTPSGQLHEIGAILAGAMAAQFGWRVVNAGASLPAEDIASAARQSDATIVALSIVHPTNDPTLPNEIRRIRRMLGIEMPIVVGGRGVCHYQKTLTEIKAIEIQNLTDLGRELRRIANGENEVMTIPQIGSDGVVEDKDVN